MSTLLLILLDLNSKLLQQKMNLQKYPPPPKKEQTISYIFKYKTACVYFIKTLSFFISIIRCTYKAFNMYMARNETLKTIRMRVALKQTSMDQL